MRDDVQLELIQVPEVSARTLVALAGETVRLTSIKDTFERWDFMGRDGGATFTAKQLRLPEMVLAQRVREAFAKDGYKGNAAALICWFMRFRPRGMFATILDEADLCPTMDGGANHVPYIENVRPDACCLYSHPVDIVWDTRWTFLGFRQD